MYIVITGTSRGIGLELTRIALEKGHHVLAVARKPEESEGLQKLKEKFEKLELLRLDILDKDAHNLIAEKVKAWPEVDAIFNNAGVLIGDETIEDFEKSFLTNSIKPFFITKALLPKLKKSKRPVSLQITSMMGSIKDNTSGGHYSYRSSKTALNMIFKSLAEDEKWLIVLLIHPGWVQTRMGGDSAPVSVHESASGIWRIFEDAELSLSGTFMNYMKKNLPW